ncbi:translation initiation factor IF-2-like [Dromiciops gliroides]|uniref:translation initiation factor IF-2-like n=1 Tax=Dromiciops gliroides TaxID=33562 RepID=UPI001CC3F9D1|nr:translation initiation factor IF-2-like [Dromiciops gliroides]
MGPSGASDIPEREEWIGGGGELAAEAGLPTPTPTPTSGFLRGRQTRPRWPGPVPGEGSVPAPSRSPGARTLLSPTPLARPGPVRRPQPQAGTEKRRERGLAGPHQEGGGRGRREAALLPPPPPGPARRNSVRPGPEGVASPQRGRGPRQVSRIEAEGARMVCGYGGASLCLGTFPPEPAPRAAGPRTAGPRRGAARGGAGGGGREPRAAPPPACARAPPPPPPPPLPRLPFPLPFSSVPS